MDACGEKEVDGVGCVWCPDPRSHSTEEDGLCLSEFDVEMAMEVMAFPCTGYVKKEDRVIDEKESGNAEGRSVDETEAPEEDEESDEEGSEEENVEDVEVTEEEESDEEETYEYEEQTAVFSAVPDFSCFSQAWGESVSLKYCHLFVCN